MTKAIAITATCIRTGTVSHFRSVTEAADLGGFSQGCITKVIRGIQKSHAGHTFKAKGGPGKARSPARTVAVHSLRKAGHSLESIAAHLGISISTAHYHVRVKL